MKGQVAVRVLAAVAETQDGLVTTGQSARVGVPRLTLSRLADLGDLDRVIHGVYRMRGTEADNFTELRAAWLALDPTHTVAERVAKRDAAIVVSHRSAAAVHGIGNLYADQHEFTSAQRKQSRRKGVRVHRGHTAPAEVTIANGMLVTTIERTLVDLAHTEPNLTDVADALADAYRKGVVELEVLTPQLDPAASRHGARDGEELLQHMLEYRGLDAASVVRSLMATPALREAMSAVGTAATQSTVEAVLAEALRLDHSLRGSVTLWARQTQGVGATK